MNMALKDAKNPKKEFGDSVQSTWTTYQGWTLEATRGGHGSAEPQVGPRTPLGDSALSPSPVLGGPVAEELSG